MSQIDGDVPFVFVDDNVKLMFNWNTRDYNGAGCGGVRVT